MASSICGATLCIAASFLLGITIGERAGHKQGLIVAVDSASEDHVSTSKANATEDFKCCKLKDDAKFWMGNYESEATPPHETICKQSPGMYYTKTCKPKTYDICPKCHIDSSHAGRYHMFTGEMETLPASSCTSMVLREPDPAKDVSQIGVPWCSNLVSYEAWYQIDWRKDSTYIYMVEQTLADLEPGHTYHGVEK
eukprot:gnl/TRDRNA2_/TRDRNA2_34182_c0_seq1.p1 gnl/TRDRNA2_/TRDRNA2_34182_c0~~gnl/TRDRNA2_/TRDRNA2_34182_c0_seq1.p1  ORF type:complete len:196 (-),score=29.16 gnl/TRDRNA2_/TRDRNA2_34182_c0_seq1:160-747(-)